MGVYIEYVILYMITQLSLDACIHYYHNYFHNSGQKYENGKMYANLIHSILSINPKVPKSAAEDPWSKIVCLRAYPQLPNIRHGDSFPFVICHNVIFFVC